MKKVEYCGYQIEIEDWAKWIATDEDGTVMQYALEPVKGSIAGAFYPPVMPIPIGCINRMRAVIHDDKTLEIDVEDWMGSARKVSDLVRIDQEEQGND